MFFNFQSDGIFKGVKCKYPGPSERDQRGLGGQRVKCIPPNQPQIKNKLGMIRSKTFLIIASGSPPEFQTFLRPWYLPNLTTICGVFQICTYFSAFFQLCSCQICAANYIHNIIEIGTYM